MSPQQTDVKVATDYKMSRHFNGIVFSVIGLMILILLALLFVFYKARHRVVPTTPKAGPSAVAKPPDPHRSSFLNIGRSWNQSLARAHLGEASNA